MSSMNCPDYAEQLTAPEGKPLAGLRYRLYGLRVASQFQLPLPTEEEAEGEIEVYVLLGAVEPRGELIYSTSDPLLFICHRDGEDVFLTWDAAKFAIRQDRIVMDAEVSDVAVQLLLQPVWAVVLSAKGITAWHAAVVAKEDRAVAIAGASGNGKSTSALALVDRGWSLVSDDVLVLTDAGEALFGPPFMRLRQAPAKGRRGYWDSNLKLRYTPQNVERLRDSIPLEAVLILDSQYKVVQHLSGIKAIDGLLLHVYNPLVTHAGQAEQRLNGALDIIRRCNVIGAPPRILDGDELEAILVGDTAAL